MTHRAAARTKNQGPVIAAGILLGAGLGGWADAILFQQLLQWHHVLSAVEPPLELASMKKNLVWDGVLQALTWLLSVAGLAKLWTAVKRPEVSRSNLALAGGLLLGWGLFNALEGTINHQLLGVHHVHAGERQLAWDLAFVGSGLLMIGAGWLLIGAGRINETRRGGISWRQRTNP